MYQGTSTAFRIHPVAFTRGLWALPGTKAPSARDGSAASAASVLLRAAARALCASPEFWRVDPDTEQILTSVANGR